MQIVYIDERELARKIAEIRGCAIDQIPDAMALFDELPLPRTLSENWATTVKWKQWKKSSESSWVCSYSRATAVRLAWLSSRTDTLFRLTQDALDKMPEGWPKQR